MRPHPLFWMMQKFLEMFKSSTRTLPFPLQTLLFMVDQHTLAYPGLFAPLMTAGTLYIENGTLTPDLDATIDVGGCVSLQNVEIRLDLTEEQQKQKQEGVLLTSTCKSIDTSGTKVTAGDNLCPGSSTSLKTSAQENQSALSYVFQPGQDCGTSGLPIWSIILIGCLGALLIGGTLVVLLVPKLRNSIFIFRSRQKVCFFKFRLSFC